MVPTSKKAHIIVKCDATGTNFCSECTRRNSKCQFTIDNRRMMIYPESVLPLASSSRWRSRHLWPSTRKKVANARQHIMPLQQENRAVHKSDTVRSSSRAEGRIEESSNEDMGSLEIPSASIDELVSAYGEDLDAVNRPNRSQGISFRSLRNRWNMWYRPRIRAGYRRLEWICVRLSRSCKVVM